MFSKHMSAHKRGKMLERLSRDGLISTTVVQGENGGRPATVVRFHGLTDQQAPAASW